MSWQDVSKTKNEDHLSASQLQMYMRCGLQYEYRYIKGMKMPPTSALVLGKTVHFGIEHNYKHKFENEVPANLNEVLDVFNDQFDSARGALPVGEPIGPLKDRGYSMLVTHYDLVAPQVTPLDMPELYFEVKVPNVRRKIMGYIDVIAKTGPYPTAVIDNKTTKRKFNQWDVDLNWQLTTYAYAIKNRGLTPDALGFDALVEKKNGTEVQRIFTSRSDENLIRFEKTVQDIERAIDSGIFIPTSNPQVCSWCGFSQMCYASAVKNRADLREAKEASDLEP